MVVSIPKLKISEDLLAAARQRGIEIAENKPITVTAPIGSPARNDSLAFECRQWAMLQRDQLSVPKGSPGCLLLFIGCMLFATAGQLGESGAWALVIGLILGLIGANMIYNRVLGVKTPHYVNNQVRATLEDVADVALQNALSFDKRSVA